MTWVYLDGAFVPEAEARMGATDRGVLHGRGLFETFRFRRRRSGRGSAGQGSYRLGQHLARLEAGARILGIAIPTAPADLEAAVYALVDRCSLPDARVRLTVTAGAEDEGAPGVSVLIQARAATDYPERLYETGITAMIAAVRRNETSPLSRVKSLNCLDNVLAHEAALRRGADEALLLNTRGLLAEGSTTNVFVVRGGEALTPPIEDGALPGITRGAILEIAREAGISAREASIEKADLVGGDEAFLTNAIAGVLPLVAVDGATIGHGRPGALTLRLRALYDEDSE